MADGHPDLNGVWQAFTTANIDLEDHEAQAGPHTELIGAYSGWPAGQSVVVGGTIPYKPEALEKRKQNAANRWKVDVSEDTTWHDLGDPEMKCYMPGVPRATYMPFPFQIVQGSSPYILISYEFASSTRVVRMNWKQEAPTDTWMGWSRGRWEGDTLVIDVGRNLVRSRRQLSHRRASRRRAVYSGESVSHDVRGDDRRPQRVHAALADQVPALPPDGAERAVAGVQVRAVYRRSAVREV
jgi:hypothetical protein